MPKDELKIKVAVLQEKVENVDNRLEKIETNHLPHIQDKLEKIESKQAYWSGGLAILVILIPILLKIFFK